MMIHFRRLIKTLVVLALFCLIFPQKAYAYLDMGTMSYILSLTAGALVGVVYAVKIYWRKVNTFFRNHLTKQSKDRQDND